MTAKVERVGIGGGWFEQKVKRTHGHGLQGGDCMGKEGIRLSLIHISEPTRPKR